MIILKKEYISQFATKYKKETDVHMNQIPQIFFFEFYKQLKAGYISVETPTNGQSNTSSSNRPQILLNH